MYTIPPPSQVMPLSIKTHKDIKQERKEISDRLDEAAKKIDRTAAKMSTRMSNYITKDVVVESSDAEVIIHICVIPYIVRDC